MNSKPTMMPLWARLVVRLRSRLCRHKNTVTDHWDLLDEETGDILRDHHTRCGFCGVGLGYRREVVGNVGKASY